MQKNVMRGLLDVVMLRVIHDEPMHGYGVIKTIRKKFGYLAGPSTIYPRLIELEEEGCLTSEWDITRDRPCKTYTLTGQGRLVMKRGEITLAQVVKECS